MSCVLQIDSRKLFSYVLKQRWLLLTRTSQNTIHNIVIHNLNVYWISPDVTFHNRQLFFEIELFNLLFHFCFAINSNADDEVWLANCTKIHVLVSTLFVCNIYSNIWTVIECYKSLYVSIISWTHTQLVYINFVGFISSIKHTNLQFNIHCQNNVPLVTVY